MSLSIEALCQCAICCEIMTDPKTLQCEHSFCKECLEECVEFDDNSVLPFITCPICRVKNNLGVGGTVSALKAQLFLRQCFDQLNLNDTSERESASQEEIICSHCALTSNNVIKWYCWQCKGFFCQECINVHLTSTCDDFREVKFSTKLKTYHLFCSQHNSFHSAGCVACTSTFCTYCRYENHAKLNRACHVVSFNQYADKFKSPLLEKINFMSEYVDQQNGILSKMKQSPTNLLEQEANLVKYLKERKLVVLSQLLFILELTEKQIKSNFKKEKQNFDLTQMKLKNEVNSKLQPVQGVLAKSTSLAGKSLLEIVSQTKDLQDEFHTALPPAVLSKQPVFPLFNIETEENSEEQVMDINCINSLLVAVQTAFGDVMLSANTENGNIDDDTAMTEVPELIELNGKNYDIDYSPAIFTKLSSVSEATSYIHQCLNKMGLKSKKINNEVVAEEAIAEEKEPLQGAEPLPGKKNKKKKSKDKDETTTESVTNQNAEEEEKDDEEGAQPRPQSGKKNKKQKKTQNEEDSPNVQSYEDVDRWDGSTSGGSTLSLDQVGQSCDQPLSKKSDRRGRGDRGGNDDRRRGGRGRDGRSGNDGRGRGGNDGRGRGGNDGRGRGGRGGNDGRGRGGHGRAGRGGNDGSGGGGRGVNDYRGGGGRGGNDYHGGGGRGGNDYHGGGGRGGNDYHGGGGRGGNDYHGGGGRGGNDGRGRGGPGPGILDQPDTTYWLP